jgi:hypothetical protein
MTDDTNAEGIPLRDFFAGQYMAAALDRAKTMTATEYERVSGGQGGWSTEKIGAVLAYRYADAMIQQRRKN